MVSINLIEIDGFVFNVRFFFILLMVVAILATLSLVTFTVGPRY